MYGKDSVGKEFSCVFYKKYIVSDITDNLLSEIWGEFDNIPISEDGETIDEDFFIWSKGHDKIDIWQWFDKHHSKGLAKGLMGLD